ncbi:MAG: 50S ribosome-binding GTPase [Planctomycetia bacterium]|nr:50S ribosome-binding GTPase [Planctomycetia bacterium]
MYTIDDIITARASAPGIGARGIIRISGSGALEVIRSFFEPRESLVPSAETMIRSGFFSPWTGINADLSVPCDLYYWGEGRGFTGQESIELHLPGSDPLLESAVRRICDTGRVRLAGPGEFTLRAFLAGRIDLTQAEAVLGIIDASGDQELNAALEQLAGGIGKPLAELQEILLETVCDLEAGLDFTEEDIEFITKDEIRRRIELARDQIRRILRQMENREGRDPDPHVVLIGAPNSGKSSLFNALIRFCGKEGAGSSEAIVSSVAGTTRDYIEQKIDIKGFCWTLVDTAGWMEDPSSAFDRKSRSFANKAKVSGSLLLYCLDSTGTDPLPERSEKVLIVRTKCDLINHDPAKKEKIDNTGKIKRGSMDNLKVSSVSGEGIPQLLGEIMDRLRSEKDRTEAVPSTALRCRESLKNAEAALERGSRISQEMNDEVLIAASLREALDQIGLILGSVHTDDILDRIFSRFCIGK